MTYIEIICRKHSSFWQKPNTHLIGKGCFECYGSKVLSIHLILQNFPLQISS